MFLNLAVAFAALASPCQYSKVSRRGETIYINRTAADQLGQVWTAVLSSAPESHSYAYDTWGMLSETMAPTVSTESDQIPTGRIKTIHSAGIVAQAKFYANPVIGYNYSGLFQGSNSALIRFSLAFQPEAGSNQIVPAAAIKFFRDNHPSANIFFMGGLSGQADYNFFVNNFSNHISVKDAGLFGESIAYKFGSAPSHWPVFTGLSGVSDHDELGNSIAKPIYPFQLVMQPTVDAREIFSRAFPAYNSTDPYVSLKTLQSIPAGTPLWKIWAAPSPDNLIFKEIGSIVQTSKAVLNAYGNQELFFRHQIFDEDVVPGSHGELWRWTCGSMYACSNCASPNLNNCVFV